MPTLEPIPVSPFVGLPRPIDLKREFVAAVVMAANCLRFSRCVVFTGTASAEMYRAQYLAHVRTAKALAVQLRDRGLTIPTSPRAELGRYMVREFVWK